MLSLDVTVLNRMRSRSFGGDEWLVVPAGGLLARHVSLACCGRRMSVVSGVAASRVSARSESHRALESNVLDRSADLREWIAPA